MEIHSSGSPLLKIHVTNQTSAFFNSLSALGMEKTWPKLAQRFIPLEQKDIGLYVSFEFSMQSMYVNAIYIQERYYNE